MVSNLATIKPRNPKGMRDFLPAEKRVRDAVLSQMKEVFKSYGFEPLETPAVEIKEILTGKIGAEEKLIYDVTYKGDTPLALRYDQTVPLARVVAQYPELVKPFKRYQFGNVYRADNPQKGRYREFLQVDIDTVGSSSALSDAEIIACAVKTYQKLGVKDFKILLNSRPLLISIIKEAGVQEDLISQVTISLDKLDKIGQENVAKELSDKGLPGEVITELFRVLSLATPDENLQEILTILESAGVEKELVEFSPSLARGLDYYTGSIFECRVAGFPGSIGAGGRYDNLIGKFTDQENPAVGFSFGFEPLIDLLREQNGLPKAGASAKVLVTVFNKDLVKNSVNAADLFRQTVP
ncbi:MAG TPA: histidine--tRNA ligase, partial [Patescibacteria group bacterium]|nr:histidine--tRNA ligase [Patescibacteria group bacterium]